MAGPAGRLDAVLVCGGRWHDFDHARRQLLSHLGGFGRVRTRVFEDYASLDALAAADILITYTCDVRPSPAEQAALAQFVERGGRWLALHGTNAAIDAPQPGAARVFRSPPVLQTVAPVLGSRFLGHPPIAPYRVEVTRPAHPLVAGISAFEVTDELYVSELYGELEVLLHARFTGACPGFADADALDDELRPVLYLKRHGGGQVCYFTLGHCRGRYDVQDLGVDDLGREDLGSWPVPQFQVVLARCVAWTVSGAFAG